MPLMNRTLARTPLERLQDYIDGGGGRGLVQARDTGPDATIAVIEQSGLRSRGGAGIPSGPKWRTVRAYASGAAVAPTAVVNAAEGEPGSFKDRAILARNPYLVIEGALIAAEAVGANEVIVAMKRMHETVKHRTLAAIDEVRAAGWLDRVDVRIFEGPNEYLYGEETALLEAIDGRPPFPRIAPPYRRGVHEIVDRTVGSHPATSTAAHVELAGPGPDSIGSPALVNNVETLANVPNIVTKGAAWFRSVGTAESPGTLVCTVTGATQRHGVGEVPMGTPLREVIELIGGGPRSGHAIKAVVGGAATPLIRADQLDTPVSNEGMMDIGARLGCGGFIVFDDSSDMAAVAEGVARFLAIESCGLCTRCKEDGLALAELFGRIRRSRATERDRSAVDDRLRTVDVGARCDLASQYRLVLQSVLDQFGEELDAHVQAKKPEADAELIASVVDIAGSQAILDESHLDKQPDWTFEKRWSGKMPADRVSHGTTLR